MGKKNQSFVSSRRQIILLACLLLALEVSPLVIASPVVVPVDELQVPTVRQVIRGKVVDKGGQPLPGVTIRVKGTRLGFTTNEKGEFYYKAPNGVKEGSVLIFSYIGFKTLERKTASNTLMKVVLEEDVDVLSEVVVTGMFQRRKEGFTGSVNQIKGEDVTKMTSGNILKAIELLDPGFRIGSDRLTVGSNPSGLPDFNMRGQASMGDYSLDDKVYLRGDLDTRPNQPLFVLDGIIGVPVTKIMDLNTELIESITILKDAAAMVIYGAQASNGVVVVETKAPETGKLRVTYNGNYCLEVPDLRDYHLVGAHEKLVLEKRAGLYDPEYTPQYTMTQLEHYKHKHLEVLRGVDSYWLSEPVQTAFSHRHGMSVEGGSQELRYKIYAEVNTDPGVMKGTGVYGKGGSVDLRYRQGKVLLTNILYIDHTVSDRTSPYGSFEQYTMINPYYRKRNPDGSVPKYLEQTSMIYDTGNAQGYPVGMDYGNPLYNTLYKSKDQNTSFDVRDAMRIEYVPIEQVRLSMDLDLSRSNGSTDIFKSASHSTFLNEPDVSKKGSYLWTSTRRSGYDVSVTASYNDIYNDKHFLSTFARYNVREDVYHTAGLYQTGFPNDNMDEIYLGALPRQAHGDERTVRALGANLTGSYTYDMKYAADLNVRMDASSEFGRNNRFAPFWSAGLRWNLDREEWIQNREFINELVFRITYGVTGTQGFSPYQALRMYTYNGLMRIYDSSDVVGTQMMGLGNPDLKWQTTDAFNVGVDFTLWENLLSGRLEYYSKFTKNTILDFSLPPSVGFPTVMDNLGNISNRGYEFTLRLMPINIPSQRLNWSIVFSGSRNRNRIEQISNALKVRNEAMLKPDPNNPNKLSRPMPRYEEGYSQSMIWAVKSLGIDPQTGREVFLTRDGQRTGVWNPVDMIPAGDSEPKLIGTISTNLNWGPLTVTLAARYRVGGMMYNRTLVDKVENADLRFNVDKRAYTDRWEKPGDLARFKAVTKDVNGSQTNASTRFIMKDDELMLNVLSLQYRLEGSRHKWLQKLRISSGSIGLYVEDLFRLSTVQVERGITYPMSRQASCSINLTF